MGISEKEFAMLARLARLEFDGERKQEFMSEFEEIINFANAVNNAVAGDTESIKDTGGDNVMFEELREDTVKESLPNEKITSGVTPVNGYFTVKRVVK